MARNKERAEVELIINGTSANASLRDLEAAARKAKSELRGMMPGTEEFNKAAANVARIDRQLQNTRVQAGLTKSAFEKMKDSITSTFIGNVGANLATLGLQKVAGYFTDAWSAAKDLSDQMADIAKTTGMTVEEVQSLNTELGKINTRTSMSDLREIAKVGGQFGVAKDELLGFVAAVDRTTIALGDEFTGGAEQVASEMSKLRNVLIDIKSTDIGTDIGFLSNAINELAAAGVATGPVVADFANRIGGYGAQVGLTSGQILGLSATLQELGVSTERGGTAVVKIIQRMLTNSQEFAKIAGVEIGAFEKMLNENLFGAFSKVMEGSKKMGTNSTLLAGIIKDLEVQGAGASEVFAKLGGNTGLLAEKVKLASSSLTNLDSITQEASLKNENFAGSVERLSKNFNKLISNPALVGFFKFFVDQLAIAIEGMNSFANIVAYNYDVITKGKTEADRLYLEKRKEQEAEALASENKAMQSRVTGYVNGLKQMTLAELEAEVKKKEILYKGDIEYARQLTAAGKNREAAVNIAIAKETAAELKSARELLATKKAALENGLNQKRAVTAEEIKAAEKKAKEEQKIAQSSVKAIAKELDEQYKLQVKHYDALFAEAQKHWNEKDRLFLAENKKQFDAAREFFQKEMEAAAELGFFKAQNDEERRIAEIERVNFLYQERINAVKEGSEQEKLLRAQMAAEIDAINQHYSQKDVDRVKDAAHQAMGVWSALQSRQNIINRNKLVAQNAQDEKEKALLKQQLDEKLISQQRYDHQIAMLESRSADRERQAMREQAQQQKNFAVFEAWLMTAVAVLEAIINPTKIPQAIAAGIKAAVITATPIPEFEQGGFTGDKPVGSYNGKGIAGVTHPNEFVINAKQLQNPYVYSMAKDLAIDKSAANFTPPMTANSSSTSTTDPMLTSVLMALNNTLLAGVKQKLQIDEEFAFKLNRELKKQQEIDQKGLF